MRSIEGMVCFDLYAASRAMTGLYRPLLDPLGLTYPQYLVLSALPTSASCTIGELARVLDLDHGTLSPLLRRLQQAGLVQRERAARDERVVDVRLTAEGLALRGRFPEVQCVVEDALGMSADDVLALQQQLKRLVDNIRPDAPGRPDAGARVRGAGSSEH